MFGEEMLNKHTEWNLDLVEVNGKNPFDLMEPKCQCKQHGFSIVGTDNNPKIFGLRAQNKCCCRAQLTQTKQVCELNTDWSSLWIFKYSFSSVTHGWIWTMRSNVRGLCYFATFLPTASIMLPNVLGQKGNNLPGPLGHAGLRWQHDIAHIRALGLTLWHRKSET